MSFEKSVSIILPIYNESDSIGNLIISSLDILRPIFTNFEMILVNDGSTDHTGEIIDGLAIKYKNLKVIHHECNLNYGSAIRSGFAKAQYPIAVFMDSDSQFDISQINKLFEFADTHEIVTGIRKKRMDSSLRVLLGYLYNWVTCKMFNIPLQEVSCGFKLFQRERVNALELKSKSGFINVEIFVKAREKNYAIKEVLMEHYPRKKGRSKSSSLKTILLKLSEWIKFYIEVQF